MNDWIDELSLEDDMQLDLLVDNELKEHQRQRLLASLDSEPERWRLLALRFVEAQMVSADISEKLPPNINQDDISKTTTVASIPHSSDSNKPASILRNPNTRSRNAWNRAAVILGICLAFAVGFTLDGYLSDTDRSTAKVNDSTKTQNTVVNSHSIKQQDLPKPDQSTKPLNETLHQTQSLTNHNFPVPLTRIRSADGQEKWTPNQTLSRSDELALRQSGFDVQRRLGFKRIRIGEQRHVVIPSQQVHIVRRSRNRI